MRFAAVQLWGNGLCATAPAMVNRALRVWVALRTDHSLTPLSSPLSSPLNSSLDNLRDFQRLVPLLHDAAWNQDTTQHRGPMLQGRSELTMLCDKCAFLGPELTMRISEPLSTSSYTSQHSLFFYGILC